MKIKQYKYSGDYLGWTRWAGA